MKRSRLRKAKRKHIALLTVLLLASMAAALMLYNYSGNDAATADASQETPTDKSETGKIIIGAPGSAHHHSTFLIFVNGGMRRFDDARYFGASPYAHIHGYSFAEIHTHASNVTLGFFLATLNITLNSSCITFDGSESYCNNTTHTLKFYVEGERNHEYGSQFTADWEHYLITYGDDSEEGIERQILTVPDPQASPPPEGRTESPDFQNEYL